MYNVSQQLTRKNKQHPSINAITRHQEPIVRLNPKTFNVALACHELPFFIQHQQKKEGC